MNKCGLDWAFQRWTHLSHRSTISGAPLGEVNLKKRRKSPDRPSNSVDKSYSSQQPVWSVADYTGDFCSSLYVVRIVIYLDYTIVGETFVGNHKAMCRRSANAMGEQR